MRASEYKSEIEHEIIGRKLTIPGGLQQRVIGSIKGIYQELYNDWKRKRDTKGLFYKEVEGVYYPSGLTTLFLLFGEYLGEFEYRFVNPVLQGILEQQFKDLNWTDTKIKFLKNYEKEFSEDQKKIFQIVQKNQKEKLEIEQRIRQRDAFLQVIEMLSQLEDLAEERDKLQFAKKDNEAQNLKGIKDQISKHMDKFKVTFAEMLKLLKLT